MNDDRRWMVSLMLSGPRDPIYVMSIPSSKREAERLFSIAESELGEGNPIKLSADLVVNPRFVMTMRIVPETQSQEKNWRRKD